MLVRIIAFSIPNSFILLSRTVFSSMMLIQLLFWDAGVSFLIGRSTSTKYDCHDFTAQFRLELFELSIHYWITYRRITRSVYVRNWSCRQWPNYWRWHRFIKRINNTYIINIISRNSRCFDLWRDRFLSFRCCSYITWSVEFVDQVFILHFLKGFLDWIIAKVYVSNWSKVSTVSFLN